MMRINPDSLQIIGALDAKQIMSATAIAYAVSRPQALARGSAFTGRSATRVFADEHTVVKLRTELRFNGRDSGRWAEQRLACERELAVHHPAKTWFVASDAEQVVIGNATPRLQPLHAGGGLDDGRRFAAVEALLACYFSTAARHDVRLDEGLSNFGVDEGQRLYYLDDDLYSWDDHTAFSAALGAWLRAQPEWCQAEQVERMGSWVRAAVLDAFDDRHQLHVLAEQLRQVFMAAPGGRDALERLQLLLLERPLAKAIPLREGGRVGGTRFGLLADVHANLPALEAVLADLDTRGIGEALVLGDIVGYGPHPRECVAALRERGFTMIQGNHDYGVATGNTQRGFSTLARSVVAWTREQLGAEDLAWLGALSPSYRHDDWLAVHGAPLDKQFFFAYVYYMTYVDNLDWLEREGLRMAFHGHTHLAGVYRRRRGQDVHDVAERYAVAEGDQALICPGAVGQTRGGRPGAEYAVVDLAEGTIDFLRLDYDVEATVRALRAAGLPGQLADRLRDGR